MTEKGKAGEARRGLVDAVTGKAKELAGALSGNDELAQEGQLRQAAAKVRRDANSQEAFADASSEQAADKLRESKHEVLAEKRDAYADGGRREQAVVSAAQAAKVSAEAQARANEQAGRVNAEREAVAVSREAISDAAELRGAAAATEQDAARQRERTESRASDAEDEAARLRAEAHTN